MARILFSISVSYDPMIQKLMDIAAKNSAVHDNVVKMNEENELFVKTGDGSKIQVHLSDKALDLLYHHEGAL